MTVTNIQRGESIQPRSRDIPAGFLPALVSPPFRPHYFTLPQKPSSLPHHWSPLCLERSPYTFSQPLPSNQETLAPVSPHHKHLPLPPANTVPLPVFARNSVFPRQLQASQSTIFICLIGNTQSPSAKMYSSLSSLPRTGSRT